MQQIDNPAISMASKLATFNMLIVLFNLIPAFPMDGGRVLRSILASFMTYSRATQIAAGAGQVFAFLFAFIGLFFNPLLIFIGLFVYLAASQEAAIAQIREVSRGIPVSEAMITRFSSLPPDTTVREAAEALLRTGQHEFPIIDNKGMLHGILSRDRIIATMKEGEIERRVSEVMHPSVPSVSPDTSFFSAFRQMQENHCPALPIVDDEGSLVGLLTSENVGEMMMLGRVVSEHRAAPKQELRL